MGREDRTNKNTSAYDAQCALRQTLLAARGPSGLLRMG